ncbi:hypothetical protein [Curtobacterium ammoniigenes]|uniref:hypothetical protein n=1 Tax=Curtobacterium ammoniigenes TaxID=395387 RepID=UPI0012EE6E12|nr:hypothetical protein [Curtobacterium ammoniigenes]
MTLNTTRKRALIAGGIATVLVGGLATGGALITSQSTIFDNVFGTTPESSDTDSRLVVTGDPIVYDFDGGVNGETVYDYYTLRNEGTEDALTVNVSTKKQPGNDAYRDALMGALDTAVTIDGRRYETGKLDKMSLPSSITVDAGATKTAKVEVFVKDASAFPQFADRDLKAMLDFQFDAVKA